MTKSFRITHIEPLPDWIRGIYDATFEDSDLEFVWASDLPDSELGFELPGTNVTNIPHFRCKRSPSPMRLRGCHCRR